MNQQPVETLIQAVAAIRLEFFPHNYNFSMSFSYRAVLPERTNALPLPVVRFQSGATAQRPRHATPRLDRSNVSAFSGATRVKPVHESRIRVLTSGDESMRESESHFESIFHFFSAGRVIFSLLRISKGKNGSTVSPRLVEN